MIWWIWIRKKYSLHKRKSKTDTSSRSSTEWHQVCPHTRNRRGKIRNILPTLGSRKNKHEIYDQLKQNLNQNQLEFCSIFSPDRFISVDDVDRYHYSLTLSDSISPTPTKRSEYNVKTESIAKGLPNFIVFSSLIVREWLAKRDAIILPRLP